MGIRVFKRPLKLYFLDKKWYNGAMAKVFIGSDHAGFALKEAVKKLLTSRKIAYQDLGNLVLDKTDDYPDYSLAVAMAVAKNKDSRGVLFCGSAQGACIVANKVKGIRAATAVNVAQAVAARQHGDNNIVCLAGGAQVDRAVKSEAVPAALAQKIITAFLVTSFSQAPRHRRRVNKIKAIERKNFK